MLKAYIALDRGLASIRPEAIIWTTDDLEHWRVYIYDISAIPNNVIWFILAARYHLVYSMQNIAYMQTQYALADAIAFPSKM